jgi:hypothetical protein
VHCGEQNAYFIILREVVSIETVRFKRDYKLCAAYQTEIIKGGLLTALCVCVCVCVCVCARNLGRTVWDVYPFQIYLCSSEISLGFLRSREIYEQSSCSILLEAVTFFFLFNTV